MARINVLKRIKTDDKWRMVSIPSHKNGRYNWKALPSGRYYIEWWEAGKRKRQAAGITTAQALEVARRKKHNLEGRALGLPQYQQAEPTGKTPLHVAVRRYLEAAEAFRKPNTIRKYQTVLKRFLEFFAHKKSARDITSEDLNDFMVHLKKKHRLGNNTVIHHMIICAQFLKKQGMPGTTSRLDLPTKIQSLPGEYTDQQLRRFFKTCPPWERALFQTFRLTGFREQEVMYLHWDDIKWKQSMIQVRAKPSLGFYPKRWEERAIPVKKSLLDNLKNHPKHPGSLFVFPSPRGNRELHMLDKCKAVALKARLKPADFNLRKFRSTYATRMLRAGFDVRTVQAWMGHKSLETTMRYLSPAQDVHDQLNQLKGIFQEI